MKLEQILPEFITEDIPLKKALCLRTAKKKTGEVMKFLRSYFIDSEKSYFLFDKQQGIQPADKSKLFKHGKYNLKNKNFAYKDQEKIKIESIDFANCDFKIYEVRDISFLKRAKANESNKDENLIFLCFLDHIEYLKEFKNKDFITDLKTFLAENYSLKDPIGEINYSDLESQIGLNNPILFYKDLPSIQPTTQAQIDQCRKQWSIIFQPSVYSKFIYQHSESEKELIFNNYLKLNDYRKNEKRKIESFLYDPVQEKIVAEAGEDQAEFPYNINHSVMKCIDNFCVQLTEEFILNNKTSQNININNDNMDIHNKGNCLLGNKNIIPKLLLPEENIETSKTNHNFNSDESIKNDFNQENTSYHEFNKLDQYYCQGLYLFTLKEPCFMCSMALVHSRIERVYFVEYNENEGALTSLIKLNSYNLNHNYYVFKINE